MSRVNLTGSLPPVIWATRPTCTPRILTLLPVSITKPARSENSVTLTGDFSAPVKNAVVMTMMAPMTPISITVHQAGGMRRCPATLAAMCLTRQIEVAGLPVHGQRNGQHREGSDNERRSNSASDGLADTGRPARGGVPVVGVY